MFTDVGTSNQISANMKLKDIDVFVEDDIVDIWRLQVNESTRNLTQPVCTRNLPLVPGRCEYNILLA